MRCTLFVAALAACGGSKPRLQVIAAPALTVVDGGDAPQRVVRISVPVHTRERAEQHVDMAVNESAENTVLETGHSHVQYPTVRVIADYEVTDVAADGTMTVHATAERATYDGDVPDPKARKTIEAEVAALRRMDRTYRMSPSGVAQRAGTSKAEMELEHDAVRFPDVPIGVGAVWKVTSAYAVEGATFNRTTTYHLRSLDENGASVELEFEADAPKQALAVDPHSSVELTRGHVSGHGLYLIPLHRIVQTGGATMTSDLGLSIVARDLRIRMARQTEIELTSKPADDATR